jgi:hypothetical protein
MTAAERIGQLMYWHELARLTVGRSARDAERLEKLLNGIACALAAAQNEQIAEAAVEAHVAKAMESEP